MELSRDEIRDQYGPVFHTNEGDVSGGKASLTVDAPEQIRKLADDDVELSEFAPLVSLPAAIEAYEDGVFDNPRPEE